MTTPHSTAVPSDAAQPCDVLAAVRASRMRSLRIVDKWLDVAEGVLSRPDAYTGREINRAGELALAAATWLTAEQKRIEREARADADAARMNRIMNLPTDEMVKAVLGGEL